MKDILNLTKKDIVNLEKTIESLKDYGYAHIELDGEMLTFSCEELIKNKEDYEKHLKKLGLKQEEIETHINQVNENLNN